LVVKVGGTVVFALVVVVDGVGSVVAVVIVEAQVAFVVEVEFVGLASLNRFVAEKVEAVAEVF